MSNAEKTCFVIAPIGEEDSPERQRSDQVFAYIIKEAVEKCGYDAIRADQISDPGMITTQVIEHLIEDALVIADMTGHNPNVFYELAIRHAIRKPVIHIIEAGETIPFDVIQNRAIKVDHNKLASASECKAEIVRQIQSAEENPDKVDTPISVTVDLKSLRDSGDPLSESTAEIITMIQGVRKGQTGILEELVSFRHELQYMQSNKQTIPGFQESLIIPMVQLHMALTKYKNDGDVEALEETTNAIRVSLPQSKASSGLWSTISRALGVLNED